MRKVSYLVLGGALLALGACSTVAGLPDIMDRGSEAESSTAASDDAISEAVETTDAAEETIAETVEPEASEPEAEVEAPPSGQAFTEIIDSPEIIRGDGITVSEAPETPAPRVSPASDSLLEVLISEELRTDTTAVMGVISGARQYCGLPWREGFITYIQSLAEAGQDVTSAADSHGVYVGVTRNNLTNANYQCNEEDIADLTAIQP